MSRTGAVYGYSMLWLAILAGALMAGFLALFLRFGLYSQETFLGVTSRKLGPWFAVVCGLSLASVNATFQFGNNLGVTAAMTTLWGGRSQAGLARGLHPAFHRLPLGLPEHLPSAGNG